MKKDMKFVAHNGVSIVFDDWCDETEEYGTYWVGICTECFKKYHGAFGRRISSNPSEDICSVKGCENEADYYIDFLKDKVAFE